MNLKILKTEKAGLLCMHRTFEVKLLNFKLRHSNDCCTLIGLAVSRERVVSNPGFLLHNIQLHSFVRYNTFFQFFLLLFFSQVTGFFNTQNRVPCNGESSRQCPLSTCRICTVPDNAFGRRLQLHPGSTPSFRILQLLVQR